MLKFKLSLFLLVVTVELLFSSGNLWFEANNQFYVAKNFVRHYSLASDSEAFSYLNIKGKDGHWYDPHGVTNVILMVPIAILEIPLNKVIKNNTEQFLIFLLALIGVIINGLACIVFFQILLIFGQHVKTSFYTTLCLAFLTIIFPYSSTSYEGNLNMLFILCSLYYLFKFFQNEKLIYLALSGATVGLAICTREFSWVHLICMVIFISFLTLKEKKIRTILTFLSGLFPLLILWGYYNWLRTDLFYITPFLKSVLETNGTVCHAPNGNIIIGLKGLLLSQGGSIFVYSPILLLSIFGWAKFIYTKKKEASLILSIIILFILANAKINNWFGLWGWGPRYTLEVTPLLMLSLGYWLSGIGIHKKRKKLLFIVLCGYSLVVQLAATLTNWRSRLGYILEKGETSVLFTAKYSQWWDSVKTLFINIWNLFFGLLLHLKNPGYSPDASGDVLYMSQTLFTWWNRLIFMKINPILICIYLFVSLIIIYCSLTYMTKYIKKVGKIA